MGSKKCEINNPPAKNPIVVTIDDLANCAFPMMQCPAVQPFAIRDPKPINIAPIKKTAMLVD